MQGQGSADGLQGRNAGGGLGLSQSLLVSHLPPSRL